MKECVYSVKRQAVRHLFQPESQFKHLNLKKYRDRGAWVEGEQPQDLVRRVSGGSRVSERDPSCKSVGSSLNHGLQQGGRGERTGMALAY